MKKHTCGYEMGTCRGVSYCWHCMVPEEPFVPFRPFTPEAMDKAIMELYEPPKPATTEPPEWNIGPLPQAMLDLAEMERKARAEVCGITDLMRGVSAPAPSPLDRALEDFIERREAKREAAAFPDPPCVYCGMVSNHQKDCDRPRPCGTLSRALSTPLPHDPDIHTRLMPWRGK